MQLKKLTYSTAMNAIKPSIRSALSLCLNPSLIANGNANNASSVKAVELRNSLVYKTQNRRKILKSLNLSFLRISLSAINVVSMSTRGLSVRFAKRKMKTLAL